MLEYNLQKEGCTTISALNGEEGIALAEKERPDLIILDIMLPVSRQQKWHRLKTSNRKHVL